MVGGDEDDEDGGGGDDADGGGEDEDGDEDDEEDEWCNFFNELQGPNVFRKQGKLAPRFIGPFKIFERADEISYRLELPRELAGINNTFHVSYLCKCLADDSAWVPLDEITLNDKLEYVEEPIVILDEKAKEMRDKRVRSFKLKWWHRKGSEFTWETEEFLMKYLPS
ncbi:uncharacterized protein [Rutidosis leptorrhynchoides]|uniref:uncharacterized protein n=1 Tax=Rutidosis leptorrhynchoides TaxID=125765 RepID=UPI003A9A3637